MLRSLTIQNYALISSLEIDFSEGFSVLTGETGAGKSIVLGALSLILGQRADVKSIKQDENRCLIEGVFDISSYNLQSFFTDRDLEYDDKHCILRRELFASGKSRAFINDSPVGLNDLKELGGQLIDIHSQHQNLDLTDGRFQMQVLDALAGNGAVREQYKACFQKYAGLQKKLRQLKADAEKSSEEQDYMQFQFQQLKEAKLKPGEQEELELEAETLSHAEEIKSGLYRIGQLLSGDEQGVVVLLKEALNASNVLGKIYSGAAAIGERLQSAYLDLKDLSEEAATLQERMEYDPERLQWVNERLDLLFTLQQKHKLDSDLELIELRDNLELKLQSIANLDDTLEQLQKELDTVYEELIEAGALLTGSRKKAAVELESKLVEKVSVLGMPNMKFVCELTPKAQPEADGIDQVNFLFSANKNIVMKPVAEIASGGEISRLMLGIKALIAGAVALPTIIFDEIDTGVSGELADKMANIMRDLGNIMQVVAITHLPQIAAKGKTHYLVYKHDLNDLTETQISKLSEEKRIYEIARMLSGESLTNAALENAKNLLNL